MALLCLLSITDSRQSRHFMFAEQTSEPKFVFRGKIKASVCPYLEKLAADRMITTVGSRLELAMTKLWDRTHFCNSCHGDFKSNSIA